MEKEILLFGNKKKDCKFAIAEIIR